MTTNEFKPQVDKCCYDGNYDHLKRFISYFYQIDLFRKLGVNKILEVGVGNKTVSNYLKHKGYAVVTCDHDKTLNPDYVASITNLPFEDSEFDCVMAYEVLEHLPFDDFSKAISELNRVSRKYVLISLPYSSFYLELLLRFPFIDKLLQKDFLRLFISVPFYSNKFLSPEHYWELGRKGYPLKKIRSVINTKFRIIKEFRPSIDTYHYFFVLSKR